MHAATAQLPVAQVPMALAGLHALPQPPQLLLVLVGVSQPVATLPEQLAKSPWQLSTHAPAMQVVALLTDEQALPQAPQFFMSEPSAASQPSART